MSVLVNKIFSLMAAGALLFTAGGVSVAEASIPDAPDAALEAIAKELSDGNGGILWEAMPASYQVDVNTVAQLAGTKIDADLYNKGFVLIARLADVADKQKSFLLNTKLGGQQPAEQIAKLDAAWPAIIGFVKTLTASSIATAEGLRNFDGQDFSQETISKLLAYSKDFTALSDEPNPLEFGSVELLNSTDTSAVLEITSTDGRVETQNFTQVESRWVPAEMATNWASNLAAAKTQLEAISPAELAQNKPQILGVFTMFEGILAQLEAAGTQEQFDQALQGAMMPIMGLIMMQQGGMGGGSAPAAP